MTVWICCETCGSRNVMRDAWAEWNVEEQKWELGSVFDHAHCTDCDGETKLEEVPVLDVASTDMDNAFADLGYSKDDVMKIYLDLQFGGRDFDNITDAYLWALKNPKEEPTT